ncbi:MAG: hypothetical protein KGJ80_13725 [Chloroflexota bacterium]|nr:hypothetical protein [Chloroflexota bacterium]
MKPLQRKRNLFMSATLMCGLFAIAFSFGAQGIHWMWLDKPQAAIILLVLAVVFGIFWFRSQRLLNASQKSQT